MVLVRSAPTKAFNAQKDAGDRGFHRVRHSARTRCFAGWPRAAALLAACFALLAVALGATSAKAASHGKVQVRASVAESVVTVALRAAPRSVCRLTLGSGAESERVASVRLNSAGRARVREPLPTRASTGTQPLRASCRAKGQRRTGVASVTVPGGSSSSASDATSTVLNVLLDLLLGGTLLLFIAALIDMVVNGPESEKFYRTLALIAGAVIALGAQAAGVSFATYIVDSLSGARPGGAGFKTLSVAVPGGISAALGWYFLRLSKRSALKALRLMILLGMLTVVGFVAIFAQATSTQGVFLGATALPNASFLAGLIIALLVSADAPDEETTTDGKGRLKSLRDALRGRLNQNAAPAKNSERPFAASPSRTNPFDDE